MTSTELADLHRAVEELRHAVAELQHAFGHVPAVRRLRNDLDRLEIDAGELTSAPPPRTDSLPEHVVVPDTPPDESMWSGADDEGVGGYHGDRP